MDGGSLAHGDADAGALALLGGLMQLELELVELRSTHRLDAIDRIREALRRLAQSGAAPLELLAAAAAELGACTEFQRVFVDRRRGDALEPLVSWSPGEEGPPAEPPRAAGALLATRPGAVIVEDEAGRAPVVAATVAPRGAPVALLRASVAPATRALSELDRELVALFADGLARLLERAALAQALERHRTALAAAGRLLVAPAPAAAVAPPGEDPPSEPLTPREREVLAMLAEGATNRAIGARLAISEGTVKYHVKNILRKLHARSRAEAVARHARAGAAPAAGG